MSNELALYDNMRRAIAAAFKVDEVKDIHDKARAIEIYSRQAKNHKNERRAKNIRLRAERRCGELLREMKKAKGTILSGRTADGSVRRSHDETAETLSDHGISKSQSSRWQKLADVPEAEFEAAPHGP